MILYGRFIAMGLAIIAVMIGIATGSRILVSLVHERNSLQNQVTALGHRPTPTVHVTTTVTSKPSARASSKPSSSPTGAQAPTSATSGSPPEPGGSGSGGGGGGSSPTSAPSKGPTPAPSTSTPPPSPPPSQCPVATIATIRLPLGVLPCNAVALGGNG